MLQIFKYVLPAINDLEILLPEGAKVLSVKEQDQEIVIYALVALEKPMEWRKFKIIGTGHPIEDGELDNYDFIDTAKLHNGKLMFHVFKHKD